MKEGHSEVIINQIGELANMVSAIPTSSPKLTEYKSELQTIISKLGNEDILSAISTLEAKIQPVTVESKEIDIMPILEQLKAIQGEIKPLELPEFKFGQNGRLLVSDVGGGGTRAVSVVDSGGDDVNIAKEAKQDDLITELKLKADLTETQPVSNASLPLPAGASTEEKQDTQISALNNLVGMEIPAHDYIARAWTAGTFTEAWTFYSGGSGGTLVATVTIIYDDVDMSNIISVTKS